MWLGLALVAFSGSVGFGLGWISSWRSMLQEIEKAVVANGKAKTPGQIADDLLEVHRRLLVGRFYIVMKNPQSDSRLAQLIINLRSNSNKHVSDKIIPPWVAGTKYRIAQIDLCNCTPR